MAEAPAQTPPPRTFTSNALTETESQTVTDLLNHLGESSYAYDSHLQLISLLHKGFVTHSFPPEGSDEQGQDPQTFGLLAELRQARESMDSRFAVELQQRGMHLGLVLEDVQSGARDPVLAQRGRECRIIPKSSAG